LSKMNKYVGIMLLSIAILLLTPKATQVRAHSPGYEVVARYGTTPTIDGTISDGEWTDASTVTFLVTGGATCTVYVKQDGSYLYVAFNIPDTTYYTDDISYVLIDVGHDLWQDPPAEDFCFEIYRDGETVEAGITLGPEGSEWEYRAPTGWTAAFSSTGTGWQTEYSIEYSKIGVTAGEEETLGVMFETSDRHNSAYSYYGWPPDSNEEYPNTWADLTSPAPWFWIPGMPLGAIAAITACFGGLGIKKLRRTPKKIT